MKESSERLLSTDQRKDEADFYVYLLHLASYNYALSFSHDKNVLDYGCGTGYGSQILSTAAEMVIGIDISRDAIIYAQKNHESTNVQYLKVDDGKLPFKDNTFDIVTSFQVIEHLEDVEQYLAEIERILKPEGCAYISTPDRETRLFPFQKPWNYYHIKEYSLKSLCTVLSRYFNDVDMLKIGGDEQLVNKEISRRKLTKLITLPFTLNIYPESLRKLFLRLLKKISFPNTQNLSIDNDILKYSFEDIVINHQVDNHTDLMAVCKKMKK